jgi:hypothetical protein
MATAPFGVGGKPRKPRPLVETTPRICVYDVQGAATAPFTAFARETTVRVVVNGKPQALDVVWEPRHLGGDGQKFFVCGCGRRVQHLYVRPDEPLSCRRCVGLSYRSKHTRRQGLNRIRRLREKLGALPSPLAPIPPRPRYWRRDYWARTVAELAAAEAVLAAQLHAMIPRVRRRLKHDRHSDRAAR